MVKNLLVGLAAVPLLFSLASADQHTTTVEGKEFVVHSRRAPVIVHRILPPFKNKHITAREFKNGKIPHSTRK